MKTSQFGIAKLLAEEGERLTAYFDIVGVPTISVGVTEGVTAEDVHNKRTISKAESQAMFAMALAPREDAVERLCTRKPTQSQFDALVSLVYNVGEGAFAKSTILREHNAGNFQAAAKAFMLYNKARVGGVLQPVDALTKRRARESTLYLATDTVVDAIQESPIKPSIITVILTIFKGVMKVFSKG